MKKILYILTVLAMLTSCGSNKHLNKGNNDPSGQNALTVSAEKTRYEETLQKAYDFTSLQSRTKYSLGSKSLSGRLNVEHGKRLCMTVTVMGIEMARVEVNHENVVIVYKMDKIYSELSIEEFASKLGLKDEMRYEALECVLLGRMFVPGSGEADAKDFKKFDWKMDESNLVATVSKPKYALEYVIGNDNLLEQTIVKSLSSNASIACRYSGYQPVEGGMFATAEQLVLNMPEKEIKASLSLSAPIMGKTWTPFVPSEAYRKVTIQELVTAVKNLKD